MVVVVVVDVVVVVVVVDDGVVDVVELAVEFATTAGSSTLEVAFLAGDDIVAFVFATVDELTTAAPPTTTGLLMLTCGTGGGGCCDLDAAVVTLLSCCASLAFGAVAATLGVEVVVVVPFMSTPFLAKMRPRFECS